MKDERTEEQQAADAKLEAAVRECAAAYFGSGFVTEYVVAVHQFDTDDAGGEEHDNMLLLLPSGGINTPVYRVLGLLHAGLIHAESEFGGECDHS